MDRSDAKLTPDIAPWLADAGAQSICAALETEGHEVYFVGGCVRNSLLGEKAGDIDLSTDALPQQVTDISKAAGFRVVPTGIDHGTVTVVTRGESYEVTTFRKDVATDGRRAVVAFSESIADDAARRDFTMNALYATRHGDVIDPLGGLPDLRARYLRFIGAAEERIREDFLRILRYFRFHAWYADRSHGFDPEALAAIATNVDGIATLSAERVGAEMQRLLSADDPAFAIAGMEQCGVLTAILPGASTLFLGPVIHMEDALGLDPDWLTRLAALGGTDVQDRLRLSKADMRDLERLREGGFGVMPLPELAYRQGLRIALGAALLRAAMAERMPTKDDIHALTQAARQKFPVRAADLGETYQGPAIGRRLAQLEDAWIGSGFQIGKSDLLALPE